MKKIILIICLFAGFTFAANAQLLNVDYGAKVGLNLSDINDSDYKMKPGFHAGLFAELGFGNFALQPEVLYSTQGAKGEESDDDGNYTIKANFDYINIPVMAKYYVADGFNIQVGPQVGFLTNAKIVVDKESMDIKEDTENIDFGVNFGLGYKLPLVNLSVDARYNLGLTNIPKDAPDEKFNNRVIQISVAYGF